MTNFVMVYLKGQKTQFVHRVSVELNFNLGICPLKGYQAVLIYQL